MTQLQVNDYKYTLQRRIVISVLGAGINQARSDDNLILEANI